MIARRLRPWAVLALVAAAVHPARAEGPPCIVRTSVDPAQAVVGQQVTYRLLLLRRPDVGNVSFERPLSFPSFRAEWLPGQAGHERVREQGSHYLVYEDRRALFPVRSGRLAIPAATLACHLYAPPGDERRAVRAPVPGATVEVTEPPVEGRPASFTGVVGRPEVAVQVDPRAVTLGGTVRVTATLTGEGNLWAAPAPFEGGLERGAEGPGAELFPHPSELSLEPGSRIRARRVFAFDLVPRRTGTLVVPSYELAFFDPATGAYDVVRTPATPVRVDAPQAARPGAAPPPAEAPAPRPAHDDASPAPPTLTVVASLALGVVLAAAAGLVYARRRRAAQGDDHALSDALRDADSARNAGDATAERRALARALRACLARRIDPTQERDGPSLHALSADELAAIARDDPALAAPAELLLAHERARFGGGDDGPGALELRAAVDALARR